MEQETMMKENVVVFVENNREEKVLSLLSLNKGSYFLPLEVDRELSWKPGTASTVLSRMYQKGILFRKYGYRSSTGRKCFGYRLFEQGDPLPVLDAISPCKIRNDEVESLVVSFLKKQEQDKYFTAKELSALDDRLVSPHSHLSSLVRKGVLESTKSSFGPRNLLVYGFRLARKAKAIPHVEEDSLESKEVVSQSDEIEEPLLMEKKDSLEDKEPEPKRDEDQKGVSEVSFSKRDLLLEFFRRSGVDSFQKFKDLIFSAERVSCLRESLSLEIIKQEEDVRNSKLCLEDAERYLRSAKKLVNDSQRLLDRKKAALEILDQAVGLFELQRLISVAFGSSDILFTLEEPLKGDAV